MISFFRTLLNIGSGITSILVYVTLVIELVFLLSMVSFDYFNQLHYYLFLILFLDSVIRLICRPTKSFGYKRLSLGLLGILPILYFHGIQLLPIDLNLGVQQIILLMIAISRVQHLTFLFEPLRSNPTQSFVGGFVLFILLGALFLMLPMAHNQPINFIDAFFTSASAVCVTGLTVFDIGQVFSPVGQFILLILIQVGGLGIMTFYALVTLSLHHRFLSQESQELQRGWSTENVKETFELIRSIFFVTFSVELLGAVILFMYLPDSIQGLQARIFYAIFHSVSAFCNAGFSLFSDSLGVFSNEPVVIGLMSLLIVMGGIGFPVIFEIYHRFFLKDRKRFKLQTKMAIYVSIILILLGVLVLFSQTLFGFSISISDAFFHSISSRTAGFSLTDISYYSQASLWFIMLLMFIGASPGSTGGGIKTTTFGLLFVALFHTLKGKAHIHVFDRHVKHELIFKALAILTLSFFIIFFAFFTLLMTEKISFFPLLFETISAYATVGLSLGVTSQLTVIGKLILSFLMFFGRVGPLTLAVALTRRPKPVNYKLPNETVLLG
jgi:trk system potassium uptake protein TrkH